MFNEPDYNENDELKGSQKGDFLEEKVIKAIENGYFKNFKPDIIIKINSIFNLTKCNEENMKLFSDEINKLKSALSQKKNNLIMIIQNYPNAKRYDLAFIQKTKKNESQFILGQITRKKEKKDMLQYINLNSDCGKFSNFFNIPEINLKVSRYHFFFVFQAGIKEDKNSMEFCTYNKIKFIKFCIKQKLPLFSDSENNIIYDIVFNNKSYSLVDYIKMKNNNKIEINDDSSSFDFSLTGKKRQHQTKRSSAIYLLGTKIYNKVKNILNKNFELSNTCYTLEEDKYFYINNKVVKDKNGNKTQLCYLTYLSYKKQIVVDLMENKKKFKTTDEEKKYQNKLKRIVSQSGFTFNCFKIIN